jgi:hypothetical protein
MMRSLICWAAVTTALLGPAAGTAVANYHTYVGRTGNDVAGCGAISAPCRSVSFAVDQTEAKGQVECVDNVDRMGVNITKSITITCDAGVFSNTSSTTFFDPLASINVSAGDVVTLRGITANCAGFGQDGVRIFGSGTVVIDRANISGCAVGVFVTPSSSVKVAITNSTFASNGNFSVNTGGGIRISPGSGANAFVSIEKSVLSGNVYGISIDTTGGGAGINVGVADSIIAVNKLDGIIAVSNPGPIGITADLTRVMDNGGFGLRSYGPASTMRVSRSMITGNATGVAAQNGGQFITSGSNVVIGNGTDGSFTGAFSTQ